MFERAYAVSSISAFRESLHDNMLALRSEGRGNDFAVPVGLFLGTQRGAWRWEYLQPT